MADKGKPQDEATETAVELLGGTVVKPEEGGNYDTGLADYLRSEGKDFEMSKEDAYREMVQEVLNASSIEEVLTPVDAVSAKEIVDQPMWLTGFDLRRSEFEVGSPYYGSMNMTDPETDEKLKVTIGWQRAIAQLIRLDQFNEYPYLVKITRARKANRFGSFPLRIEQVRQEETNNG